MTEIIIAVVAAAGIPSALFGFLVRRLEKKMDQQEAERKEKEQLRIDHEITMMEMTIASLGLAEATAEAVQKIPETKCNGEMTRALEKSREVQERYKDLTAKITAKSVVA